MIKLLFFSLVFLSTSFQDCSLIQKELEKSQKVTILERHNYYRNLVALNQSTLPSAKNMYELIWDQELETKAQSDAENCPSSYHSSPSTTSYTSLGEIQWTRTMESSPELNLTSVIDYWYTEGASFQSGNINPFQYTESLRRFTQLLWASTTKIGCGYARSQTSTTSQTQYLVCYYYDKGNTVGDAMYQSGSSDLDACTSCSDSDKCDGTYTGLCNNPKSSDYGDEASSNDDVEIESKCSSLLTSVASDTFAELCLNDAVCKSNYQDVYYKTMTCVAAKTNTCRNSLRTLFNGSCYCECKVDSNNVLYKRIMNAYNNHLCTATIGQCVEEISGYINSQKLYTNVTNDSEDTSETTSSSSSSSSNIATPVGDSCPIGKYKTGASCYSCTSGMNCYTCSQENVCDSCLIGRPNGQYSCQCEGGKFLHWNGDCENLTVAREMFDEYKVQIEFMGAEILEQAAYLAFQLTSDEIKLVMDRIESMLDEQIGNEEFSSLLDAFEIVAKSGKMEQSWIEVNKTVLRLNQFNNLSQIQITKIFNILDALQTNAIDKFVQIVVKDAMIINSKKYLEKGVTQRVNLEMENGIFSIWPYQESTQTLGYYGVKLTFNDNITNSLQKLLTTSDSVFISTYLSSNGSYSKISQQKIQSSILRIVFLKLNYNLTTYEKNIEEINLTLDKNSSYTVNFDKGTGQGVCSYLNESNFYWEQSGMSQLNTSNTTCYAQHTSIFGIIEYDQPSIQYIVMVSAMKICSGFALIFGCLLIIFNQS